MEIPSRPDPDQPRYVVAMVLRGRKAELAELAGLLERARAGLSGVLVFSGPAGIGKTALLDHAIQVAGDLQVTRVAGVEAEQELGFAALHRLLLPFLGERGRLPAPQRDALETAFGLLSAPPPDRFLVGLAVLTLLAEAAANRPILMVCDDAQWMDRESLEVVAFVARRLYADGIVLLFGVRDDDTARDSLAGLPESRIEGLSDDDAAALLGSSLKTEIDRVIVTRLLSEADGNPLAIRELARALAGGDQVDPVAREPLPLNRRLEARFLRRVSDLDTLTQQVLLVAAADSSGDLALVRRAIRRLSAAQESAVDSAIEQAVRDELLAPESGEPQAHFRHPLIRSAVYGGALCPGAGRCTPYWPRSPIPSATPIVTPGTWPRPRTAPARPWRPSWRRAPSVPASAAAIWRRRRSSTGPPS
ncbi:hypothetical protein Pth03_75550 [Planotetraspora thailandica]|uniref:Orc1-like AAA ATPase domain-containing protein n=1 Tax=Planotetraspora thailandica TaxID=487172 RepID=A0A8J3Y1R4_9ACTN|nr:AAA family ATPase [Planotetraspora thailandica]GII59166.1 hypothetical protein Pth03_75550 [Planotetraspora thailandica]